MRLNQISLVILTLFALTTGCSPMNHGDPKNPKKNPHPVKRYEVIATSDAPGPWDSVTGYLNFELANQGCTPKSDFVGVHLMPQGVEQHFDMTHVGDKTWKGYFYRDMLQDENYFDLGLCHWDVAGVTPVFATHGKTFASARGIEDFVGKVSQTEYFRKSDYVNWGSTTGGASSYLSIRPEVVQRPNAFFSITVKVIEVKP